jgi:glutaminase
VQEPPLTIEARRADRRPHEVRVGPDTTVTPDIGPAPAEDPAVGSPLAAYLARSHERHRRAADGTVATYIPELGRADPSWFGIAAATLDGRVHEIGDTRLPFTIQSISKPLTYGLVLDDLGEAAVRARIGVEPTGDAFNSITLAPGTGLPLNPMVNAGAIAAAGLVRSSEGRSPIEELLAGYGRFTGRSLTIDTDVLDSERTTGHRNRAIGQLLRASGAIEGDVDSVVERYFAQCSVSVTAADLAVVAATLANGGVNPVTGARAISAASTQAVLAVMATCGMYDGAGEWLYAVGLPAKSGVSGGIMVVVPGQLGIAVFSPPLDAAGNSVRGVRVCRDLVRDLGLHPLRGDGPRPGPIRASYTLAEIGSKRGRSAAQRGTLAVEGTRCRIIELQGVLSFLAPDDLAAAIATARADGPLDLVVLDMRRVERLEPAGLDLLAALLAGLSRAGIEILVSGRQQLGPAIASLERAIASHDGGPLHATDELDTALEAAEERLLTAADLPVVEVVGLADQALVRGLGATGLAAVAARLERRSFAPGERIVEIGAPSRELFLLERGHASVSVAVPGQGRRRLSTLGAGMSFGEAALLDGGRRTADVHADTEVDCLVLTIDAFEELMRDHPDVAATVLRNLLRSVGATAARLTREVAVLAS